MKTIRSKDNPAYRDALRLLRKKYRNQTGMFLIEGPRPVTDAVKAGNRLETVFIRESAAESPEARGLVELCAEAPEGDAKSIRLAVLADGLFDRVSDTENSRGIIAVARKSGAEGGIRETAGGRRAVILDRLQDPGNIGTIIRTAEAAGFGALIAIKGTGDIYSPKTVRAAAGSLLRVDVFEGMSAADAIGFCKEQGVRIIASDLKGSVGYTEAGMAGDIAVVIGNEGSGISGEFRDAADTLVRIPMEGEIESLNAGAAAAILMYESMRQRRAAGKVK
ncbi:MAG: TrmH family RNA methyltransferase [Bacillota bacterium]